MTVTHDPRSSDLPPPLWDGYCADPFVVRDGDRYVMYGTAPEPVEDGRAFRVLVSDDLDHWSPVGGALELAGDPDPGSQWWAPEVAFEDGRWWMYYSVGIGDSGHVLRVATAEQATGPFVDTGDVLTPDLPFAIDPSPFRDRTGQWWLYYATDLLDGDRPGTGLAVQRLDGMRRLVGPRTVVVRATADWQRYQASREIYGGVHDWHTCEGPAVLEVGDRYVLLYSGGNWQTPGYGVAQATAPTPEGPWTEPEGAEPLVSSRSTGLVGPGHCSLLEDEGTIHLFLHAWDDAQTRRRPYRLELEVSPEHELSVRRASRVGARR